MALKLMDFQSKISSVELQLRKFPARRILQTLSERRRGAGSHQKPQQRADLTEHHGARQADSVPVQGRRAVQGKREPLHGLLLGECTIWNCPTVAAFPLESVRLRVLQGALLICFVCLL